MAGRKQVPYTPTFGGQPISGLYRTPGTDRWKIIASGERFTCHDERQAIQRFEAWQAKNQPTKMARLPIGTIGADGGCIAAAMKLAGLNQRQEILMTPSRELGEGYTVTRASNVPEREIWQLVRETLLTDPAYAAQMTGLPELAGWRHLNAPGQSLKLSVILDTYEQHNPSTERAKGQGTRAMHRLMKQTGALTLADLTTERLQAFKHSIETDPALKEGSTRAAIYGKIKAVIGFGLKHGLDAAPIQACLARCKVLWTNKASNGNDPHPISREHFHKLLATGNGTWRPWLLVGLNLCMHLGEVCELQWDQLDLDAGTYAAIRGKSRRQRIPRAATLWPETITALKAIRRRGPNVFISKYGVKYSRNSRVNDFKELRDSAGLSGSVTFDTIRDGSYTSACHAVSDERLARVLAGHRAAGYQDRYVLRSPEIVRPACEAVYATYGPFPA